MSIEGESIRPVFLSPILSPVREVSCVTSDCAHHLCLLLTHELFCNLPLTERYLQNKFLITGSCRQETNSICYTDSSRAIG